MDGRRIRAERADAYGQQVDKKLIRPARRKAKPALAHRSTTEDLVQRNFARQEPNQLWMTDITEHPRRVGKLYCCASSTPAPGG